MVQGRDQMYDHVKGMGVDPRGICQRIMDVSTCLLPALQNLHCSPSIAFPCQRGTTAWELVLFKQRGCHQFATKSCCRSGGRWQKSSLWT